MQILWREVFGRVCPFTVDEFLFCYKPSEINQSLSFYQFTARGKDCSLIKSLASSDRNWKIKFIFVSGFWAGNPMDVGKDPFAPYSVPPLFHLSFFFLSYFLFVSNPCLSFALQVLNDHS